MTTVAEIVKTRIESTRKLGQKLGTKNGYSIINKHATVYYADSDMDWAEQKAIALENGWKSTPCSAYLPDDFGHVSSLDMEDAGVVVEDIMAGLFSKVDVK